jgi:hypothetical protein
MAKRISEISLGTTEVNNNSDVGINNYIVNTVSKSEITLRNAEDSEQRPDQINSSSRDTIVSINS